MQRLATKTEIAVLIAVLLITNTPSAALMDTYSQEGTTCKPQKKIFNHSAIIAREGTRLKGNKIIAATSALYLMEDGHMTVTEIADEVCKRLGIPTQ